MGKTLWVGTLLVGILLTGDRPIIAQGIPALGLIEGEFVARPYVPTFRSGNLEFAPVFLDGKVVGTVSARIAINPRDSGDNDNNLDAAKRSYLIHNKAQRILDNMGAYSQRVLREQGITHPAAQVRALKERLVVEVAQRNNTIAVVAAFPRGNVPDVLYSVTQAEIERSRIISSQPEEIAQRVADIIHNALITAWQERQRPHLWAQGERALLVLMGLGGTSFVLLLAQKFLTIRRKNLDPPLTGSDQPPPPEGKETTRAKETDGLGTITQQLPKLSIRQRKSVNALCRSVLFWGQWLLWLLGIGYIGSLFYVSRPLSNWIIGISIRGVIPGETFLFRWPPLDWLISFGQEATLGSPLLILLLLLITRITIKGGDVLSDMWAERWSRRQSNQRYRLRAPTLTMAFKGWLRVIVYFILGVVAAYHLQKLGTITQAVAVILGFLSFAISLASQNLLKDLIAGLLILWEDQYAVGDVIVVNDQGGLVERLTLRITQLRNLDGELITIPNGTIEMVKNLSSEWSRVNYAVEVNYDTDVKKVMAIMTAIANEMCQDPEWQTLILEPPEILGVDNIAHTGILIRLLIKTQPLQQWPVAREYRLRLKNAFDDQGISVGIPRQNVYLNETLLPSGSLNAEAI
ncbi:MAG: mechanosensitive ion channel family protein [Synechocystis sp.]|nr:mechanosensitive ion channel family protein [Synechocystis sp.]